MNKFVRNLLTEWRRLELPFEGETVVVAVSGGADSTALLLALDDLKSRKKLEHEFIVAHLNHKLRGKESDLDAKFVRKLASNCGLEFVSACTGLDGNGDLEQRARNARHAFFAAVAKAEKARLVVTGHTVNDQAETFLLNLIRGSGIDGLKAMPTERQLSKSSKATLVRPLLSWATREATEQFCREQKVRFRRDRMNNDQKFTRVRIRKSILPALAKINPKIVDTLARTATLFQEHGHFPQRSAAKTNKLSVSELKELSSGDLNSVIRAWLTANRGNSRALALKHIEAVARLVNSRKSGRIVELPGGDTVVKGGGHLAFRHIKLEY